MAFSFRSSRSVVWSAFRSGGLWSAVLRPSAGRLPSGWVLVCVSFAGGCLPVRQGGRCCFGRAGAGAFGGGGVCAGGGGGGRFYAGRGFGGRRFGSVCPFGAPGGLVFSWLRRFFMLAQFSSFGFVGRRSGVGAVAASGVVQALPPGAAVFATCGRGVPAVAAAVPGRLCSRRRRRPGLRCRPAAALPPVPVPGRTCPFRVTTQRSSQTCE